MKRYGNLWPQITDYGNLYRAYKKARKGKADSAQVSDFAFDLEWNLHQLRDELILGTYVPGAYRLFTIYERKQRLIAAAPFRDRVVHHALMNVLEPILDKRFIYDSYACRKDKGVHRAVDRYQKWARRYAYVMKLDIASYFHSIDHAILKQMLRLRFKDQKALELLELIIDSGPDAHTETGIPIGNLTSQIFANLYLDQFDHFIKETLKVKAYLRYVDDMLLLGNDKEVLWQLVIKITDQLAQLKLMLHPRKIQIYRTCDGVDVLGYRVFPGFRRLRNDNGHRFARKLKRYAKQYNQHENEFTDFHCSVHSWIGHAMHADSVGLRSRILGDTIFIKGNRPNERASRFARGFLEQQTEEVAFRQSQQEPPY